MGRRSAASKNDTAAQDPEKLQEKLSSLVPIIFDDAQNATSNPRKNVVKLYKLQVEAAKCQKLVEKGRTKRMQLVGEKIFNEEVLRMLNIVVEVKKGVRQADNIGKFIGEFVKHIHEKALEEKQGSEEEDDEETTASRFTARILRHLIPGLKAANKTPRYRAIHILCQMVSHLGEVDEDNYKKLKTNLIERLSDKEAPIRVQAAQALCKLCSIDETAEAEIEESDDDENENEGETEVAKVRDYLVDSMRHDPSAEVRREIVEKIPISMEDSTLEFLIERARDTDISVRTKLYKRLYDDAAVSVVEELDAEPKPEHGEEGPTTKKRGHKKVIGFTHPRVLSIQQREDIIKYGLRDREPSVKAAATKLLAYWLDIINLELEGQETAYPGLTQPTNDPDAPFIKEEDDGLLAAQALSGGDEELTEEQKKATGRILDFLGILDLAEPDRRQGEEDEEEKGQLGKQEEDSLAAEALLSIFASRPDLYKDLKFVGSYWKKFTPETAFLARVFVDQCKAAKDETRLDAMLPTISALAAAIQSVYNQVIKDVRFGQDDEVILVLDDEDEEAMKEEQRRKEQTLNELLKLAVNLDYADEAGRHIMSKLMRDMLSQEDLPFTLITRCLDVLRVVSSSEKDLIRIVVEIVDDLRNPASEDPFEEEESFNTSFSDAASARRRRRSSFKPTDEGGEISRRIKRLRNQVDMRCLDMIIGTLERVNGTLEENSTLNGPLNDLIIPSLERTEMAFQKKGITALGLCSLISVRRALKYIGDYRRAYKRKTPPAIKSIILKVVFDALMVHERQLLSGMQSESEDDKSDLIAWLTNLFKEEGDLKVQALLAMGIAKLVLVGMIKKQLKAVLYSLIFAYFSVDTASNQELRQWLTYFFQVYCYSSPINQKNMQEVFVGAFLELSKERRKLSEEEVSITSTQVAGLFLAWTDPTKLASLPEAPDRSTDEKQQTEFIHLHLAMDIFKAILKPHYYSKAPLEKDDLKVLYQLLPKLHLPDDVDDDQIRQLRLVMDRIPSHRPFRDATTRNAYNKFKDSIFKKYEKQLEGLTEENFRKLEMYSKLFEFLDDIIPLEDDDEAGMQTRDKSKKRRSCSIVTHVTEGTNGVASTGTISGHGRAKRPRISTPDANDSDSDVVETGPPPTARSPRPSPRPRRTQNQPVEVIEISSDDEEDPPRRPVPPQSFRSTIVKQEPPEPEADNEDRFEPGPEDTPEPENAFDSLLDTTRASDSEEDEDEVNDLLAGAL